MGWWNEITAIEQVLYILAASSTIILLIQTVLSMVGLDSDLDVLNEASASGPDVKDREKNVSVPVRLPVFTIRGILSFFAIGTWASIVLFKATESWTVSFTVGAIAGVVILFLNAKTLQWVMKYADGAQIDIQGAVGTKGEAYLSIPPKGEGKGKVSVTVEENLRVYDAIAYEDKKIPIGSAVRVLDVAGPNMLLVESVELQQNGKNT